MTAATRTTAPMTAATRATAPPATPAPQAAQANARGSDTDIDPAEDPSLVADALEQNLAWLPEGQRPELFTNVMRGEYELVLEMLRGGRRQYPRVLSIPKTIEVVERALTSKLLRELGRRSDEIVVHESAGSELDDSPRSTLLRLGRMSATLGELLDRCPLPKLATVRILRDLSDEGALVVREPSRRTAGLRLGGTPGARPATALDAAKPRPKRG